MNSTTTMLGLQRHKVVLHPHDRAWMTRAVEEIQRIAGATGLPLARVQHVGSTSVPALLAKPILDINIGVLETDDTETIVANLIGLGFIDRGDHDGGIGRLVVWEIAPEVRAVHVHIIPYDSIWWTQDLAFRDGGLRFVKVNLLRRIFDAGQGQTIGGGVAPLWSVRYH